MSLFERGRRPVAHPHRRPRGLRRDGRGRHRDRDPGPGPRRPAPAWPRPRVLANHAAGVVVGKLGHRDRRRRTRCWPRSRARARRPAMKRGREGRGGRRGPAGSLLAWHLARDGASRHGLRRLASAREALRRRPDRQGAAPAPAAPAAPIRCPRAGSSSCRFESGDGRPRRGDARRGRWRSRARRDLDAWLLRRAVATRARCTWPSGWSRSTAAGRVRTAAGRRRASTWWSGADGAGQPGAPDLPERRRRRRGSCMAAGWYARGTSRDARALHPRPRAATSGCSRGPTTSASASARRSARCRRRALLDRLEREVARSFPALAGGGRRALRAHDPVALGGSRPRCSRSRGRAGRCVGDAAALADPITGEGITYALRSAAAAGRARCARTARPRATPSACSPTSAATC